MNTPFRMKTVAAALGMAGALFAAGAHAQIKIAVEQVFGVKVVSVNTINRVGKRRRTRAGWGKRPDTKRAIVTVAEGQRIDIFGQA